MFYFIRNFLTFSVGYITAYRCRKSGKRSELTVGNQSRRPTDNSPDAQSGR